MTRINTNVSSLIAQRTLGRTNAQLQTSLTRLSTGLRINTGKDDPAGLIASEALRSEIISVEKAITNTERANQLIATADSALGQVSQLLNDIRGLVSEAANTGALSDDQIAANQLQIDSSLEAIDRIAKITSFQGKRLLDGSLDFVASGVDRSSINGLQIDQANFGTQTSIGVEINVVSQASRGSLNYAFGALSEASVLEISGAEGAEAFAFDAGSTIEEIATAINLVKDATGVEAVVQQEARAGQAVVSSFGADNDILLTANEAGFDPGNVRIKYSKGSTSGTTVTYTEGTGEEPATLDVALQTSAYSAASVVVDRAGDDNAIRITSKVKGEDFNGVTVAITTGGTAGAETITYDHSTKTLTLDVDAASTAAQVVAAFSSAANEKISDLFSASLVETVGGGAGVFSAAAAANAGVTSGGVNGGQVIATANDVITEINSAQSQVVASLADGNDGHEAVSEFQQYAFYGAAERNNRLQFLAPANAPDIRFVSVAGQSLGIDTSTDPRVEGFSSFTVQNDDANGSFTIRALLKGEDYDGYTINIVDNANVTAGTNEYAVLDKESKTLTINIDNGNSTANHILAAINNDAYINQFFEAENFGSSTGADTVTVADLDLGETSGGLVSAGTLIINLETDDNGLVKTTANDLIAFFDDPSQFISDPTEAAAALSYLSARGISVSNAEGSDGSGLLAATSDDIAFSTSGTELEDAQAAGTTFAVNGENAQLTFTAVKAGAEFDDVQVLFVNDASVTAGTNERAEYDDVAKTLTFYIEEGATTAAHIEDIFDSADANYDEDIAALFSASLVGTGAGFVTTDDSATLTGGVVDNGSVQGAALLGNSDLANLGLTFQSTRYGSDSFVQVKALSGLFTVKDASGEAAERSDGTDVNVRINGIKAVGRGLHASLNTASLDLSFSLSDSVASGARFDFDITGGGAIFQLGPDVVSNQQARLGIQSVSTANLRGVTGGLFELRSGGVKSLTNDVSGAAAVVNEVIGIITSLRGRLGAFQKTTLDSNIFTLNDTLAALTDAESSIRDADFAAESARLTRAQILVQSGTSVLAIANQNPQNVLALLR